MFETETDFRLETPLAPQRIAHGRRRGAPAAHARRTLLVVSREMLNDLHKGHAVYVRSVLAYLRSCGYRIVLVIPSFRALCRRPFSGAPLDYAAFDEIVLAGGIRLGRWLVRTDATVWFSAIGAKIRAAFNRLTGRDDPDLLFWRKFWDSGPPSRRELAVVRAAALRVKPAAVLVNHFFMAAAFDLPELRRLPKILITHDIFFERTESFARAGLAPSYTPTQREQELAELRKADVLLAIQEREAATLRKLLPEREVMVVGVSFPIRPPPREPETGTVLFVGSDNDANFDGLEWFLAGIWPRIRALCPDARLRVCGDVANRLPVPPQGVASVGRVPDLTPEYHAASLCVVPLRIGSGLKIKLVDALCHGCPVVTTGIGAQGLESVAGTAFIQADDEDGFAREAASLLSNPSRRRALGEAAVEAARRKFSAEAVYGAFRDGLEEMLAS
jgi:glycosyltransferase involved in cell wall biosynthesis